MRIAIEDALDQVLKLVNEHGFSQFPVYAGEQFRGVLTENGITRWIAAHVETESILDLSEVRVARALREEEHRRNWKFVGRDLTVEKSLEFFRKQPLLEVLLITAKGRASEGLLGIVTRWDASTVSI